MQIELKFGEVTGIAETHGGELVSFKDHAGKEYIWDGNPAYWTGRNPNLFPVVGNLKNGSIMIDGKAYHMGRHGFARNSEFAVAEKGEDYIIFELCENKETLNVYPFRFSFQIEHRLTEHGFTTEYRVKNTGDCVLPYCVGAHTAFNCPMNVGEKFEDYVLEFEKEEEASTILLSERGLFCNGDAEKMLSGKILPLDYGVFARLDTVVFRGLNSTKVSLKHKKTGHGVQMEFEQFPMIAFWTKGTEKAPYICLEPWHGCAGYENETGEFLDKPYVICLQPGESKSLKYSVELI